MIKSIQMKNCATFGDSVDPISDLKKVNFIYGANGSGKSTISGFLKNPTDEKYSECTIERSNDFSVIVVYNREFREEHFKDNIDGVFTLGKATKEQIEEVEKLKEERKKLEERIAGLGRTQIDKRDEYKKAENVFVDSIWNAILKGHEDVFADAFSGFRGSKKSFYEEYVRRVGLQNTYSGTYEDLVHRAKSLLTNRPERCELFLIDIDSEVEKLETLISDEIWQKVIVGNKEVPLAKLISELQNGDWVRKGRNYIISGKRTCPFCQKDTIDDSFLKELEKFFDTTYENNIAYISKLSVEYQNLTKSIIEKLKAVKDEEQKVNIGQLNTDQYGLLIDKLCRAIEKGSQQIELKKSEPARSLSIESIAELCNTIVSSVSDANTNIKKHNEMVLDFNGQRKALVDDIWSYCISEQRALLDTYNKDQGARKKALDGLKNNIEQTSKNRDEKDALIIEKQKNITSVQPAVDEINRSLKAYGFNGFKIVPSPNKDNAYQIQREDGSLANHTLSEGEETFISFLYFMQYAKGSPDIQQIASKKVIVLDDPICSLDSNVLYVVSAMVKELAEDVKKQKSDVEQVIVLTHNVFFHKEDSFVNGRISEEKEVNYWIISKENNSSFVRSYGVKNPISTSYELLWRELRENTSSSLVTTQNIMRRIIENYFGILGKRKDDTIINSFSSTEDKMICRALLYWINDGSHSINDDLFIDSYTDSIEKYKNVFKQIFANTHNLAHYNMMMGISDDSNT